MQGRKLPSQSVAKTTGRSRVRQVRPFQATGFTQEGRETLAKSLLRGFPSEAAAIRAFVCAYHSSKELREMMGRVSQAGISAAIQAGFLPTRGTSRRAQRPAPAATRSIGVTTAEV